MARRMLTLNDRTQSASAWARELGLTGAAISLRLKTSDDMAWVLRPRSPRGTRRGKTYTYNGVTRTIPEWSQALGIAPRLIYWRLKRGQSLAESFRPPGKRSETIHLTHNDETRTNAEWARLLGIPASTFRSRLRRKVGKDLLFAPGPQKRGRKPRAVHEVSVHA